MVNWRGCSRVPPTVGKVEVTGDVQHDDRDVVPATRLHGLGLPPWADADPSFFAKKLGAFS